MHACRLAAEMEIPVTVIPASPGTFSATGLLVTDLKRDYSTTRIERADRLDLDAVEAVYAGLEAQGREALEGEGIPAGDSGYLRQADIRYVGQSYELTLPLPAGKLDETGIARRARRFPPRARPVLRLQRPPGSRSSSSPTA